MAIKRIRHGWTNLENADKYQKLLHDKVFPGIEAKQISGYLSIELFRADLDNKVGFITIMTFNSLKNVIDFNRYLEVEGGFLPIADIVSNGAKFGISNVLASDDGYIDKYTTIIKLNNYFYYSTPLILTYYFLNLSNEEIKNEGEFLTIGTEKVQVDNDGGFLIDFEHTFDEYEFHDIIDKSIPAVEINDKLVIVGINYTGGGDHQPTRKDIRMLGLELTAHATQTLIDMLRND